MWWSEDFSTDNDYIKYEIGFEEISTSIADNTSVVNVRVWVYRTNTGYTTYGNGTVYCTVNGILYTSNISNSQGITHDGVVVFNINCTIPHNSDGSKTLTVSAHISHDRFSASEHSFSHALTTIARASTPTTDTNHQTMGGAVVIFTNRLSSSFTHTVTWKFGSASGTVATGVTGQVTWWTSEDLANQVPNATSGTATITVTTYSGSTNIGSKSVTVRLDVPASKVPVINSITLSDPNNLATRYGGYVQTKSKLKVQVSASGVSGSTIKTITIVDGNNTVTVNPYTSNLITGSAGQHLVMVYATDSRGRTTSGQAFYTVLGYNAPTIGGLWARRCNSSGTADEGGSYIKIEYQGSIVALNNHNSHTGSVQYKKQTSSSWSTAATISAYSVNTSVVVSADTESSYDVRFVLTDDFSSTERSTSVAAAFTLVDYRSTGHGIAFGKVSESDRFECNLESVFKKCTTQAGNDLDNVNKVWYRSTVEKLGSQTGMVWTHYEGASTSTYNIPDSFCEVICCRYANRGIALAIRWNGSPKLWINSMHDDTGQNNWHGWVALN